MGIKRHPQLNFSLFNLLSEIINEDEIDFFTQHFKPSFKDSRELIEICKYLLEPLGDCYLKDKLLEMGILPEWIEIALNLFNSSSDKSIPAGVGTDDRVLVIGFLG